MDDSIRNIIALLSSSLMFAGGTYLIWEIYRRNSSPSLSARIIFVGVALISVLTFLADGNKDLIGAVVILTDLVMSAIVGLAIIKKEGLAFSLQKFEKYYLFGAIAILIFWFLTKNAYFSFIFLQVLVVIGYAPVIHKMLRLRRNVESSPAWILFLLSFLLGAYPAYTAWISHGELLSLIYVLRGVVCLGVVIIAGFYFDLRKKST